MTEAMKKARDEKAENPTVHKIDADIIGIEHDFVELSAYEAIKAERDAALEDVEYWKRTKSIFQEASNNYVEKLREQNMRQRNKISELNSHLDESSAEINALQIQNQRLIEENKKLKARLPFSKERKEALDSLEGEKNG